MAIRHLYGVLAASLACGLAACTTLVPETTAKLRALDYLNDDLASLVVALDVPSPLQPVPELSTFHFDFTSAGPGERHVAAALTLPDPGELAGTLPPPGNNRAEYLFGFSDADKAALREAQAWARGLPSGAASARFPVSVTPHFCTNAPADPSKLTYSVLVALPNASGLQPLANAQPIAATLKDGKLPAC